MGIFGKMFKSKTGKLIDDLKDDNQEVRKRAVYELGRMAEPAVDPLIQALKNPFKLTFGPQDALASIGEPAIDSLVRVLKDSKSKPQMRFGAISTLSKIGDGAGESVISVLREKAVEPLIETLPREDCKGFRFAICAALGNIGSPKAIEPLRNALETWKDDKMLQEQAEKALNKIEERKM
jgi:HEAT repeat protein